MTSRSSTPACVSPRRAAWAAALALAAGCGGAAENPEAGTFLLTVQIAEGLPLDRVYGVTVFVKGGDFGEGPARTIGGVLVRRDDYDGGQGGTDLSLHWGAGSSPADFAAAGRGRELGVRLRLGNDADVTLAFEAQAFNATRRVIGVGSNPAVTIPAGGEGELVLAINCTGAGCDRGGGAECGDGACDEGEDCPADCPDAGGCDGACDPVEDCLACPADCPDRCDATTGACGDGVCQPEIDCACEAGSDCGPAGCQAPCDGTCDAHDCDAGCPQDCPDECETGGVDCNGFCEGSGVDCERCRADCRLSGLCATSTCGDGACDAPRDCVFCPDDCGPGECAPVCGDYVCMADQGETAADCPDCAPVCGDGQCTGGEGGAGDPASDCPRDCGDATACRILCDGFLDIAGACFAWNETVNLWADYASCEADCAANDVVCRRTHLGYVDPEDPASADFHCPHAAGRMLCP